MNNRISKFMYDNVNEKIEKLSKIMYIVLVKVNVAACNISPLIATIVNYYIYKLDAESFYLTSPAT